MEVGWICGCGSGAADDLAGEHVARPVKASHWECVTCVENEDFVYG